jgi:hypothetical protein
MFVLIDSFRLERGGSGCWKRRRLAVGDPRLVLDIRMGREIRPAMIAKLERFMTQSAVEPKL